MERHRRVHNFFRTLCILLSATSIQSSFHTSSLLFATASVDPSSTSLTGRSSETDSSINSSTENFEETPKTIIPNHDDDVASSQHVVGLNPSGITVPSGGSLEQDKKKGGPLKILFLSADTGGGHRASAESLANQFMRYYPGSEYDLLDMWSPTNMYPFKDLVPNYKIWSAKPIKWKIFYHLTNTMMSEALSDVYTKLRCSRHLRAQLLEYDPDVIISVHPTMNMLPMRLSRKISKERGKYVPFFTVVTDFGSAHCTWFTRRVDKMYIASKSIRKLAKRRGLIKDEKLVMTGLPIRHDFSVQAENMGERHSESGKKYCAKMKESLGLDSKKKTILLMGGGEGVGSLATITEALYKQLRNDGVDATICVVCGRNEKLKEELSSKNWEALDRNIKPSKRQRTKKFFGRFVGKKARWNREQNTQEGNVNVVGLGFVTNMAEYMVATDVLVSKAGPGSIAEAAALGLPVMITSFLPGQEAGNVDIVVDGGFGLYRKYPNEIAGTVTDWLNDNTLVEEMSKKSAKVGNPNAASDIVIDIGTITHECIEKNKTAK